jgi:hypothetical protein
MNTPTLKPEAIVIMKVLMLLFWAVMPYAVVGTEYYHFRETYCLIFRLRMDTSQPLQKMTTTVTWNTVT